MIGKAIPHESARGHVTGEALYTDDLVLRFPGILHAWPVMAPHAHALVLELDTAPASRIPGVVTVLTTTDVPGEGDTGPNRHDESLFPSEVLFYNQPVAWVLGETLEDARLGACAVRARYQPLPAILTLDEAIRENSFHSLPMHVMRADAQEALAASSHRIQGEVRIGGQEHFYLETQCAIAWLDETGGVALHSSTQHPAETQEIVARVLGRHRHEVTVECLRMGGAFGGKETQANTWAAIAAVGAVKTKRPVRVRLPRRFDFQFTGKRHPFLAKFDAGYDFDGRIQSLIGTLYADGGWSLDLSEPIVARAMFHADNCYLIPALDLTGYVARTHKTSQTAFRGFGGPQGMVLIEDILDRIARQLSLPPHVVRERNFYREGDVTHYSQPVKDAERIGRIWQELKTTSDFENRLESVAQFNSAHPHRKRGIAITPAKFGISFTATLFNQAGALVLVYRDGSIQVNHGGTEMGQGLNTKILQVAAHGLGVDPKSIRLMPTRTDKVPNTSATAASSGTDLNGAAVLDACRKIRATLDPVAAALLKCDVEKLRFAHGRVTAAGCAESLSFHDVADAAYRQRLPLFAHGFYKTPEIHYNPVTFQGRPFYYFAYGAAVSEVEVDGFTGDMQIKRVDILEDAGNSLSPLVDRGQIEGGFMQGIGWLTMEELLWDGQGRLATGSASTYKLPSWSELPEVFHVSMLERAAEPGVVFGSKAVGEPPLMLAISVREAIRAAIAAFGPGGLVELEVPATPEKIFFAIERARPRPLIGTVEAVFRTLESPADAKR